MTLTSAYKRQLAQNRQRGFTLLELLLVLGILGMAAMLLRPGLATLDSPGFNAQAREATGLLNYARRMAVVQGVPATVVFMDGEYAGQQEERGQPGQRGQQTQQSQQGQQGQQSHQKEPGVVGHWVAREIQLSYRNSADQLSRIDQDLRVTFYPEGGSTGGELILRQDNREATISVDPFSGRVRVLHED